MKKLATSQLIPGMTVGSDVQSYDNRTVLTKGTVLTDTLITRLELYGILSVYIDDTAKVEAVREEEPAQTLPPAPESELSEDILSKVEQAEEDAGISGDDQTSYFEKVRASREFKEFEDDYQKRRDSLAFTLNEMVEKNIQVDAQLLIEGPLEMVKRAGSRSAIMDMLHLMRGYDDATYTHCMNVALLNYVLAGWMGWDEERQTTALASGLFHDVGKLRIPKEILLKPARLDADEFATVRKHSIFGYELLKRQNVSDSIRNATLMHHERYDGSGYPLHLKGEQIDPYARLTSISDVYDAMTSARVYRGPLCPFRVVEIFEDEGLEKYDPDMILTFLKNVCNTYLQTRCRLSDGRIGTIIMLHPDRFSRPVVDCDGTIVDLREHKDLSIDALI
ncbi:MAG: HD-GYP domain-containing protein [Lachnospiraceae bacterium]|nr:HD-GYP domain-containing protein [Lachnospiraceae bacterium]